MVFQLTSIYSWIERDLGASDQAAIEDQIDEGFDNMNILVDYFQSFYKSHKYKYGKIQPIYEEVQWK